MRNQALEIGGVLVGDEVDITLEVEMIKKNSSCEHLGKRVMHNPGGILHIR